MLRTAKRPTLIQIAAAGLCSSSPDVLPSHYRFGGSAAAVRDREQEQALIVPTNQPAALAEAIERLYGDSGLGAHLKENALSLVRERFLWEHVAPRYGELYRQAAAGRAKPSIPADAFVRQRRSALRREMAVLMGYAWNQKHYREALRLLQDVPGLAQKVLVLGLRKITLFLHRKKSPVLPVDGC